MTTRLETAKAVLESNGATDIDYFCVPKGNGARMVWDGFSFTANGKRLRASYMANWVARGPERWRVIFDCEDTPTDFSPLCERIEVALNAEIA